MTPRAFARVPLEGLLLVALALLLPVVAGRVLAVLIGVLLGVLTLVKVLDMGFFVALGRPFKPVSDWTYFGSAEGLLDRLRRPAARDRFVAAAAVLGIAILVGLPLSMLRLTRLVQRHRGRPCAPPPRSLLCGSALPYRRTGCRRCARRLDQRRRAGLWPGRPGASRHQGREGVRQALPPSTRSGTRRAPAC